MHIRSKEEASLRLYKKENSVREEHFYRTMHGTAIDKARAVEQCRPIGQQLLVLVQLLIATQSRYATIEKYILAIIEDNRVHIAQVQKCILELYVITSVRHILLFILCHNKGIILTTQISGE